MKNRIQKLLAGFVLVLATNGLYAQQLDSKGTEFWLGFPGNYDLTGTVNFSVSSDVATTGMWEIPGLGLSDTFSVAPGVITQIPIPNSAQVTTTDGVTNQGIRITSLAEVTVYGVNIRPNSTDAYLGLPVDILGKEYIALGYQGNISPSQMTIVATDDNTTVTITPSFSQGARVMGVPYVIALNKGQVYQLRGSGSTRDVSGTLISSDKKIAVYGGTQCVNIPTGYAACDIIVEQIPPINTWGKSFVALPLARKQGSTFRVLASEDNTIVLKDGNIVATINRGQFYEVIDSTEVIFESTKPVLVAQYCHGQLWDNVTSDPFMMLIPPFEQYLGAYTVATPTNAVITDHFLNIIAPNGATGTVLLDGVLIPSGDFNPIGSSGFSGVTKQVALGSHTINSTAPVGVHSYGYGNADSYGYPGGQSLSEVASADSLSLSLATGLAPQGDTVCVVQATVLDSANNPLPGIRVDFVLKGVNPMSGFIFTDTNGVATFCYYAANAGLDTVSAATGGLNASGVVRILPCSLVLSATQVNILNANPGSINLTVSGNVDPPTYAWTGPNGYNAATQDLSGLTDSGTYKVVVTDPYFSNCKDSLEVKITASTTPCAISLSTTQVNIVNANPGSIDLTVVGAMGALTYSWTGPNAFAAATQDISGLTDSGTYKVVVTDLGAPNCKDSISVKITASTVGIGNCDLTCLSDGSWAKSTTVTPTNLSGLWMGVNGVLPATGTFTDPVDVGQPFPWAHVTPVGGADPITTGHSITYFRKTFNLTTTAGIEARFRMNVDDQAEIYVNGALVARIAGMGRSNYRNPHHDARFYGAGSVDNGYLGGDAYDFTTGAAMSSIFQVGANELIVVVRNLGKATDKGGFSMRMDLTGCGIIPKSAEVNATPVVQSAFEVYPNPTTGDFAVYMPNFNAETGAEVRLYDLNGRMISEAKTETELVEMNISELPAGVYYLKVNQHGETHTQKIVKQ